MPWWWIPILFGYGPEIAENIPNHTTSFCWSKYWWPNTLHLSSAHPQVINTVSEQLEGYRIKLAFHKCLIYTSPQTAGLIPSETPQNILRSTEGFELLGSPFAKAREQEEDLIPHGLNIFMQNFCGNLMQKLQNFQQLLLQLKHNTQSAFRILLLSMIARIDHLLRSTTSTDKFSPFPTFVRSFDNLIWEIFQAIFGCSELNMQQVTLIRLPERFSGLGLLSAEHMASSAYLFSLPWVSPTSYLWNSWKRPHLSTTGWSFSEPWAEYGPTLVLQFAGKLE